MAIEKKNYNNFPAHYRNLDREDHSKVEFKVD